MKNVNELDAMLSNLIKENRTKINSKTPKNPTIPKNDEWRTETHWDDLYKEMSAK